MTIAYHDLSSITVGPRRQRRNFDGAKIFELANSIQSLGLLQPIVLDPSGNLVAGERRLRACQHLAAMGQPVRWSADLLPIGQVPVVYLGYDGVVELFEAELAENIKREDLTWQERAAAIADLHALRLLANPSHTVLATAQEVHKEKLNNNSRTDTTEAIIVSRHLEDKEIASAASAKDAMKILRKREEKSRLVRLSESIDVKSLSSLHRLYPTDFREADIATGSVDVILTDPPYGMDAQAFNDGGDASTVLHEYDDCSGEDWAALMQDLATWSWRVTKEKAHAYIFCDIDQFAFLRELFTTTGWWVHRTPLVYAKSHASSRRVPWPEHGPRRSYELVLYAVKGKRNVNSIVSDVFTAETDENLGHAAQKPVSAYTNLLKRSVAAGDTVCDPFCGTGTIFPAAHECKCRAIGMEKAPAFVGIAAERLEKLK